MPKKRINIYLRENTYNLIKDYMEIEQFDMSTCIDLLIEKQLDYLKYSKEKAQKQIKNQINNKTVGYLIACKEHENVKQISVYIANENILSYVDRSFIYSKHKDLLNKEYKNFKIEYDQTIKDENLIITI